MKKTLEFQRADEPMWVAPRVVRLRAMGSGLGDCTGPGSGDSSDCTRGNAAANECDQGEVAAACDAGGSDPGY